MRSSSISSDAESFSHIKDQEISFEDATESASIELHPDQISSLEQQSDVEDNSYDKELEAENDMNLISTIAERRRRRLMSASQISQNSQQLSSHVDPIFSAQDSAESQSRTVKGRHKQTSVTNHSRRRHASETFSDHSSNAKKETKTGADDRTFPLDGLVRYRVIGSKMLYTLEFTMDGSSLLSLTVPVPAGRSRFVSTIIKMDSRSSADSHVESPRPLQQPCGKNVRLSAEEDATLLKMKERQRLPWKEVGPHFPNRSLASLQVHYSTKLKE